MSYASLNDIYNNPNLTQVNQTEFSRANNNFQNASRSGATGTVPLEQGIFTAPRPEINVHNPFAQLDMSDPRNHINYSGQPGTVISELTGKPITKESFHNNQVPFISQRSSQQNTDPHTHSTLLANFTGTGDITRRKQKLETASFADVRANSGNWVNGTPALTRYNIENRFHTSKYKQGEKPFQDIKIGPGLNAGFGTDGQGGVQQANSIDFARAHANRTINNRLPNNPKISYTPPVKPGALPGGSRGLQASVRKHKPERWYRNEPDRYFVTGGAIKAQALREKVNAKATRRQNHRAYYGGIGTGNSTRPTRDPAVRKTRRINHMTDGVRNAYRGDGWVVNADANDNGVGDYGLNSVENKPNERDVTQMREQRLNLTMNVKKLISPLADIVRRTRKENFIGNIRPDGNMSAQIPSKLTIHDPNDVARTTIKETTIDNSHSGFLKGPVTITTQDPADVPKTTLKELNIHNNAPYINCKPQQPTTLRVYDPDDVARTTLKEMTEDSNHTGFVQYREGMHPGGYTSARVDMKATNKQFNSNYYYTGVPSGEVGKGGGRGYLAARYKAKNTVKQFLSDHEYTGSAGFYQPKQVSYSAGYNALLNPNKEKIARGRAPTITKEKLTIGGDKINISYNKLEGDRVNSREPTETFVYQAPPQKNMCGMTNIKQILPEDVQRSRIDPDILSAYKNNPYAQSLSSVA